MKMDLQKYADMGTTQALKSEASLRIARNVEIEIDEFDPTKLWIWMIEDGERVEGGTFNMEQFISWVLRFYNNNM
jgi:hypothetical protein